MTYQAPPPGSYPGAPIGGGEHPKAQTLLITSLVALICCAPVNIWVLITANGILQAPGAVLCNAVVDGVEQVLVAEGFGQKLDGTVLHGFHAQGDVAVPGVKA